MSATLTREIETHSRPYPGRGELQDRRSEDRVRTVFRIGKARGPTDSGLCRILNISNHGLMIEASITLSVGDRVDVGLTDQHQLEGRVVWLNEGRAGVALAQPIECFALLRRLSEQHWNGHSRSPRVQVTKRAVVKSELGQHDVLLEDISQRGMRVRHSCGFRAGVPVVVTMENGIEARAVIRWSKDGSAGMEITGMLPYEALMSAARF